MAHVAPATACQVNTLRVASVVQGIATVVIPIREVHMSQRRSLRWVLLGVGIVIVVCCGVPITGGVLAVRAGLSAWGPVNDATNAFVNDLQDVKYADAYGGLCTKLRSQFTLDQFTQQVLSRPAIHGHRLTSVSVKSVNGRSTAQVGAELTRDSGAVDTESFALTKEDGGWKVCSPPAY
jgi:hypothetical protein